MIDDHQKLPPQRTAPAPDDELLLVEALVENLNAKSLRQFFELLQDCRFDH